jgi:GT2 family glycosyltransferase
MKILAIIVSYNFQKWIDTCLGSLLHSDYPVDILVIDNCSSDNTVSIIQKQYPNIRLILNNANLGFGQANNIGLKIASTENYDAVLLLNQDAWINSNAISTLIEISRIHPDYGILSPIQLSGDRNKLEYGFSKYIGINSLSDISKEDVVPTNFINAAIWFIPIDIIKKVGMFAPLFYHYGEDKDFANRVKYAKYKIGYSPIIFGCHDREHRVVSRKNFFHAEYVYLLSEYTNINYSFTIAFCYGILAGFQKSLIALLHGHIHNSITFFQITLRILAQTRKVCTTRKESLNHIKHYQ